MSNKYLCTFSNFRTTFCAKYSIENFCTNWRLSNNSKDFRRTVKLFSILFRYSITIVFFRFFNTKTSVNIERFQLKLSTKAKEAFEQITRIAQERLEGDQTKVLFCFGNQIFD